MSMTGLVAARSLSPSVTAAKQRYRVNLVHDWEHAAARWRREAECGAEGTLFQNAVWLDGFYAALKADPAIAPLIAFVEDTQSGAFAFALPLVSYRRGGILRVEFADLGMTDFNAPLTGVAAPRTGAERKAAWMALCRALRPADVLCLQKMPPVMDGRINPLTRLVGAHDSAVNGNLLTIGEDYEAWRYSLPRVVRKELERSWRVFTRHADTTFRAVTDPDDALKVLAIMEAQQEARLKELGLAYTLGNPVTATLYREFLRRGLAQGFATLSVLTAGEEIVAALLGLRHGADAVFVRLTHAGGEWSNVSPGRLVISRALAHLHGLGVRRFEFSVGNFSYKRRFGTVRQPLFDVAAPLSLRGVPAVLRLHAGAVLRRHPRLRVSARRLLGRPPLREEA